MKTILVAMALCSTGAFKLSQKSGFIDGDFEDDNDDIILHLHKQDQAIQESVQQFKRAAVEERMSNLFQEEKKPPQAEEKPQAQVQQKPKETAEKKAQAQQPYDNKAVANKQSHSESPKPNQEQPQSLAAKAAPNSGESKQKENTPKDTAKIGTEVDLRQKSDPIYGSLGIEQVHKDYKPVTEEQKLEADLASRKPVVFDLDPLEHPETQSSIEWAEKQHGQKMATPTTGLVKWVPGANDETISNYGNEDDEEIVSTLENAHLAEKHYGMDCQPFSGKLDAENANSTTWINGALYKCVNGSKQEWWNNLERDNGQNGMVSTRSKANEKFYPHDYYMKKFWGDNYGYYNYYDPNQQQPNNSQAVSNQTAKSSEANPTMFGRAPVELHKESKEQAQGEADKNAPKKEEAKKEEVAPKEKQAAVQKAKKTMNIDGETINMPEDESQPEGLTAEMKVAQDEAAKELYEEENVMLEASLSNQERLEGIMRQA